MTLSNQAMGAIMMALQKCLMEQSDITEILKEFAFQVDENEQLIVLNPPVVQVDDNDDSELEENNFTVGSD